MNAAPVSPLAASLHRMEAADASRARVLFCEPLSKVLAAWVPGLALSPWRPAPGAHPPGKAPSFGVLLRGRNAELWLQMPTSVDAVSAAILAAGAWSPAVQLSCLVARAKAALGDLIPCFGTLGLQPVSLEMRPEPLTVTAGATLFECWVAGHRIEGFLRSSDGPWLAQLESVITRQRSARWVPLAGLMAPLRARLGTRRFTLGLMRSLEAGDVVLLDGQSSGPAPSRSGIVVVGSLSGRGAAGRRCQFQGHNITITGDHWMNTEALLAAAPGAHDGRPTVTERGPASDPIADVEIDLHFELQVLSTPLSELSAMRPGYVIELPMPAAEATVSMVAGGQVVGRAQLVSIGDRLGARILELFHADR